MGSPTLIYEGGSIARAILDPEAIALVIDALNIAAEDFAERLSFDESHPGSAEDAETIASWTASMEAMNTLQAELTAQAPR